MLAHASPRPAADARIEGPPPRIPAAFDAHRDVFVILGSGADARILELRAAGVQRIVLLTKEDRSANPELLCARSPAEAIAYLLEFDPPPVQVVIDRIKDGGFGEQEARAFSDALRHRAMNGATFAAAGATWIKQALANLPQIAAYPEAGAYFRRWSGVPAIVVSPGPSLAKNIGLLREARNKTLIIAGNRALKPLREAGVVPHVVVVNDALNLSYQLSDELLAGVQLLALDVVSHPEVVALRAEQKLFYATCKETLGCGLSAFSEHGHLRSGGSVATVAYSIAVFLGADRIALVGQDLSLAGDHYYISNAPDGETRIELDEQGRGTFQHSSSELRGAMARLESPALANNFVQDFFEVPGWNGGTVTTSRQFSAYRDWFAGEAARLSPTVRSFNCTEGGASIDAMCHVPLRSFLADLEPRPDLVDLFTETIGAHRPREAQRKLAKHVERLLAALLATEAETKKCERLRRQAHTSQDALTRLDAAEAQLNRVVADVPFIVALDSAEVEAARRQGRNASSLSESLEATGRLYRTIERAVQVTRPLLMAARKELKT